MLLLLTLTAGPISAILTSLGSGHKCPVSLSGILPGFYIWASMDFPCSSFFHLQSLVVCADVGVELALIEGFLIGVELEVDIAADIDHTFLGKGLEDFLVQRLGLEVVVARSAIGTGNIAVTRLLVELVDTEGVRVQVKSDRLTVTVVGLEGAVHSDDSELELVLGRDLVDLVPLEVQEVGEELAVLDGDIRNLEGGVVSESLENEILVSDYLTRGIETVGNLDLEGLLVRGKTGEVLELDTKVGLELREASLVDVDRPDHTDIVGRTLLLVVNVVVDQRITQIDRFASRLVDNITVLVPIPSPNSIGGNSDLAEFLGDDDVQPGCRFRTYGQGLPRQDSC